MALVGNAVYVGGHRRIEQPSLEDTFHALRELRGGGQQGLAWIGLYRPDRAELETLAEEFGLHPLAVEDALEAHQRPKLERYGTTLFVVLRAATYSEENEAVETAELHLFVGRDFVVTVRHGGGPRLAEVRRRMEEEPDLLGRGAYAVLYAILDEVVDEYEPVIRGLENDVDEIETQVFSGDAVVSARIYKLSREIIEFERAARPLSGMVDTIADLIVVHPDSGGGDPTELRRYLRDVDDHARKVAERVERSRQLLQEIMTVNLALVGQRQNEEMKALTETSLAQNEQVKKISSWAAIIFAPTLVGTIYGMNFDDMPELHWAFGYPFALALMVLGSTALYAVFRAKRWL